MTINDDIKNMVNMVNGLLIEARYSDKRREIINVSEATIKSIIILINENQKNIIDVRSLVDDVDHLSGLLAKLKCG